MLRPSVSADAWASSTFRHRAVVPTKPDISIGKTKARIREFFDQNAYVRQLCDENKRIYPRMHQSVQNTAIELILYYVKNWGKSTARNNEIRITYSYLRRALNDSCCIATLKNHINKLLRIYKSFIRLKTRGGLGLANQNTACTVLEIDPTVIQFKDERHNEAIRMGILSAEEQPRRQQEAKQELNKVFQEKQLAAERRKMEAEKRMATPSTLGEILQSSLGDFFRRE